MASVEYQNSILWRGDDPSKRKFKPKYDNTHKVERYFPGKAPRWANDDDEDVAPALQKQSEKKKKVKQVQVQVDHSAAARQQRLSSATSSQNLPVEDSDEAKLLILQDLLADDGEKPQVARRRHHVLESEVKEELKEESDEDVKANFKGLKEDDKVGVKTVKKEAKEEAKDEEEDEEMQGLTRAARREQALLRRQAEEKALRESAQQELQAEPEESSSEYESVTDDEAAKRTMLKPVFVPQSRRETVKERENREKEEEEAKEKDKENLKKRKLESKEQLLDRIKADDDAEKAADQEDLFASDVELPDDDDEKDEAEEYDLWKIRELKRIKREREDRASRKREIEFIERRRNMTDEERAAEDKLLDAQSHKKEESKNFSFLQKYYHRGGYFQDKAASGEEALYLRDYHQPLEEEKYDKNLLPKAMQVRRGLFGKKGQVKHTHLTEVDTTDKTASWAQGGKLAQKYQSKMAGTKAANSFDRPAVRGV